MFFFWLLYCSLQRFYSVTKWKTKWKQINKGSLEESTILRSYRLTSVLRALKPKFVFISRHVTLRPAPSPTSLLSLALCHFFPKRKQKNKVGAECPLFSKPATLCTVIGAGGSFHLDSPAVRSLFIYAFIYFHPGQSEFSRWLRKLWPSCPRSRWRWTGRRGRCRSWAPTTTL